MNCLSRQVIGKEGAMCEEDHMGCKQQGYRSACSNLWQLSHRTTSSMSLLDLVRLWSNTSLLVFSSSLWWFRWGRLRHLHNCSLVSDAVLEGWESMALLEDVTEGRLYEMTDSPYFLLSLCFVWIWDHQWCSDYRASNHDGLYPSRTGSPNELILSYAAFGNGVFITVAEEPMIYWTFRARQNQNGPFSSCVCQTSCPCDKNFDSYICLLSTN